MNAKKLQGRFQQRVLPVNSQTKHQQEPKRQKQ